MRVAIVTSSDSGYNGRREDLSGPVIRELTESAGYQVVYQEIFPDDRAVLERELT